MTTVTQVGDLKNSTLTGSPGQENDIYGDAVHMTNSKGGNDALIGGATATNRLFGDALTMDHSKGGNDALIGGANGATNVLCGDTGDLSNSNGDLTNSTGGNDTLIGGANAHNVLAGDTCNIMVNSTGGNDTLIGGGGAAADNILVGDAREMITSTGGNDRLVSGANATDQMWGDFAVTDGTSTEGHDSFVFGPSNGTDFVWDFQPGKDHIELDGFGALTFASLDLQTVDANSDGLTDSVIHFDPSNSVTVYNVTNLIEADFLFVA